MGDRVILHSDINSCYASIELLHHPELRGKPLAVGGDPEARHGIVLTADYVAKKHGVKTGMALWQAKQVCPDITFVPPRMDLYLRFSRMAHEIYGEYTDLQEPYGIDESWLDVTASASIKGDGYKIAQEISNRMKSELGITVSVGVSFNKIFAKLGSDYKKPDAITTMYKDEFQTKAWNLPASDLLYVGRSTDSKLRKMGIHTIGDIARADEKWLNSYLGKMGSILWSFANGYDTSPVRKENTSAPVRDNDNGTLRKGTVDNLRKTAIPERRMIIWGEAGIGKSTTLEYLAYSDAQARLKDKSTNIPILFLLGIMLDGNYSIKQYICDKLKVDMQECDKLLSSGKINLFLDGLNEIPTGGIVSNLKTIRMREIRQLMMNYPKTFIIITNRPQDSRDFDNIPVFNLQKLNDDEIKLFLEKNVTQNSVKKTIMDALTVDKNFRKIIRTPLILSRLVATVQYTNIVPKSEGAIIGQFLKCLFEREKNEKLDERLDIQKMTYLLRVIAFESLENKEANAGMTESELIGYCSKCMASYKFEYDALYAIGMMVQLGILERRENVYVFSHQSYQDYYYGLEELAVLQS